MNVATQPAPAPENNAAQPAPQPSPAEQDNNQATPPVPENISESQKPKRKPLNEMTSADIMQLDVEDLMELEQEAKNALASTNAPGGSPGTAAADVPPVPSSRTGRHAASDEDIAAALQLTNGKDRAVPPVPGSPSAQGQQPPAHPGQQPSPEAQATAQQPPLTEKEQIAYLAGQLAAMQERLKASGQQGGGQDGGVPQENERTTLENHARALETNIGKLDDNLFAQRMKLAEQLKDGEIEMPDYVRMEHDLIRRTDGVKKALNEKLNGINQQLNAPNIAQQEQQLMNSPALKQWTADLEAQNPWLTKLTQPILENLRDQAVLDMEGLGLSTNTVEGLYNLRVRIVQLGKEMGYEAMLSPLVQQQSNPNQPAPANPAQAGGNGVLNNQYGSSQPTPAQREEKLNLAQNHPPQITNAGVSMPTDPLAMSHLDGMSAKQMSEVLPQSTLEKLGGFA